MLIPPDRLPPDTLRALIENFVTRDGTADVDLEVKVAQVATALKANKVVIVYDAESDSFDLLPMAEYRKLSPVPVS